MPSNPLTQSEINDYAIGRILTPSGELNPYMPPGYFLATHYSDESPALWRLFDASYIQSGIIDPNRLGTGSTGAGSLYLADDGQWKVIGGGGGDMYKCFHPDTELLTLNGWKKITDISFDDEVATLNQKTKELEYQVPNHIFKYEYDGELLGRETKQLSYLVTPNHRMYVRKWYGGQRGLVWSENFHWERADEVSEKTRSFPITAKWNGVKTETNPFGIDDDLFLEFLGWFLAEGCVVDTKIYVTQTKSKTIADCTRVMVEMARSLERTLGHNQNAHFNFRHSELAKFLNQFGKHAHNKFIPSFIKNLPSEKLILFYSAYYKGDGHLNGNNITTVSKRMADDLQEIILKLGGYATITRCSPAVTSYGVRDFYRLNCNFNNLQGSTAKKDNYKIDYKGFVHCVEVDNATLYTRFNGKPVFLGNSTYDTDNSGIVDKAEALMTLGRNSTGATLYKGTVIRIQGSTGHLPNFVKAQGNNDANSAQTFGIIATDIANNSNGYAIVQGTLDDLDTRPGATHPFTDVTLVDGDILYLHPTIPGYLTNVKPSAPQHMVYVGVVTRTSPTNGTIVYRIQNGYELDELHDVAIASKTNNDLLVYESSTDLWKNKTFSAIFGGTPLVSVPTLAQVTTAGNTTTNAITVGGLTVNTTVNSGGIILQQNGTNIGEFRRVGNNNRAALYLLNSGTTEILLETGGFSYIRSNGFGIGTATDAGYKLDVNGTARVQSNFLVTNQLRVDSGRVTLQNNYNGGQGLYFADNSGSLTTGYKLVDFGAGQSFTLYNTGNYFGFANVAGTLLHNWSNSGTFNIGYGASNSAAKLGVTGSITASSAIARGVFFNNTLVAAANDDVLVGLDINPTFTNGAFTGVSNVALRVTGRYYQNAGSNIGILSKTSNNDVAQFFGTGNYAGIRVIASSTLSAYPFISLNTSSAIGTDGVGTQKSFFQYYGDTLNYTALGYSSNTNVIAYSNSNGNVVIGGGAGFTDAGQKLQVLGNAKFSSATDTYHYITSTATGSAGTIYTNTYHSFFTGTNYATANSWEVYDLTSSASRIHISGVTGNVAINQTYAVYKLDVAGDIRSTTGAYLATTSGFVGIGTMAPASKLDVVGDVNVSGVFAIGGVGGWTGTITIMTNPPGQQNIQVVGGIITNVS